LRGYGVLISQNIENITGITLGSVGNKYIVIGYVDALVAIVILCDCMAKKVISLFGAISAKRLTGRQFTFDTGLGIDIKEGIGGEHHLDAKQPSP